MSEDIKPPEPTSDTSQLLGVSMRAWLALIIVGTVCAMYLAESFVALRAGLPCVVTEPLYSMAVMTLGFYFGQKTTKL